ncbi:hypothetical protein LOTGIDRAFT_173145 [Lottia gigantea]|uniref:MADF domain-containing protein n=1 Tax=Lottia gigantea TaxID=225164 RepID=V4AZ71_LOTGI|nr:hypothetical protein LOTGIDRAFT_173145 [Lottia gigantea]ESP00416.1 hypothetical protein LOTGIDRAFT_173145 [Lottia gigantea]
MQYRDFSLQAILLNPFTGPRYAVCVMRVGRGTRYAERHGEENGKTCEMRDSYMKQRRLLKEKESGDAATKVHKWKFFDILWFLEPYIAGNEADTNVPDIEETGDNDSYTGTHSVNEDNGSEVSSIISEPMPLETAASSVSPTPSTSTGRVGKTPKKSGKRHLVEDTSSIESALTDFINESKKNHEDLKGNTETNPDELLFASYAKRMKELPKSFLTPKIRVEYRFQ